MAVAVFAAARLVPGIEVVGGVDWQVYAALAIVLGLVNALIRPVLSAMTCLLQVVTLGLFTFVLNAIMFWLSAGIFNTVLSTFVGGEVRVDGFLPALLGALIVSVVSTILNTVFVSEA
jgi:putative membrane protein